MRPFKERKAADFGGRWERACSIRCGRRRCPRLRHGNAPCKGNCCRDNFWLEGGATAATLFALFDGFQISDVSIEDVWLDGNRSNNEFLNGNHIGCIYLRESNRVTVRRVVARNFNGDGISWQVAHDVRVVNCESVNNAGLGLHPGSGAQRAIMVGNKVDGNDIGIFFCWGVRWSLAEKKTVSDTCRHGISRVSVPVLDLRA